MAANVKKTKLKKSVSAFDESIGVCIKIIPLVEEFCLYTNSLDLKSVHFYVCRKNFLTYPVGWFDFLQKHASYCGNLGMTHKDEKWQK